MLTLNQLQTLKADIAADPVLSLVPNTPDGDIVIADAYNQIVSPNFIVWKTSVPTSDIKKAVIWTEYILRSTGERDAFFLMISDGYVNSSDPNIRQGFLDIFSGPGGATSRANLAAISKRSSTRAEKLFASGTGSDASPATMSFEGQLSHIEVGMARALP